MVPMQPIKQPNEPRENPSNGVSIQMNEISFFVDSLNKDFTIASSEVSFASSPISEVIQGRGTTLWEAISDLKKKVYEHAARYEITFALAKHLNVEIRDRDISNSIDELHETEIRVKLGLAKHISFVATGKNSNQALRVAYNMFTQFYVAYRNDEHEKATGSVR